MDAQTKGDHTAASRRPEAAVASPSSDGRVAGRAISSSLTSGKTCHPLLSRVGIDPGAKALDHPVQPLVGPRSDALHLDAVERFDHIPVLTL